MNKFPRTLEAVRAYDTATRQADGHLWAIGAALISECGPPGPTGVNNGSQDKIGQVAKYLAAEGFEFSLAYLRQIRRTAFEVEPAARAAGVAFGVYSRLHNDAQLIAEARQKAESEGKKLTVEYASTFLRDRKKDEEERQRRKNDKLKDRPKPDVAYEKALADFAKSLGQAEGACDYAADLFARHLSKQISDLERANLISGARSLARRYDNLAETMESKSPLAEAAE